jgi:hypothetical protein
VLDISSFLSSFVVRRGCHPPTEPSPLFTAPQRYFLVLPESPWIKEDLETLILRNVEGEYIQSRKTKSSHFIQQSLLRDS